MKKITLGLALLLSTPLLEVVPVYAAATAEATQSQHLERHREALIAKGYEVLEHIKNGSAVESALPIIEGMTKEEMYAVSFNPRVEKYSFFTRWLFNSDDLVRREYLSKIIALGWAFDDMATKRGELFSRGSFTLIDPKHKVYNFLLSYIKLVTGNQDPVTLPLAKTTNNFGYRRDPNLYGSSHHKGRSPEAQFGIDVRFHNYQTVYGLLPHMHRHILFGKLAIDGCEHPKTFIKFEPVGLGGVAEAAVHALNWKNSYIICGQERREKDIVPRVKEEFLKHFPEEGDKKFTVSQMLGRFEAGDALESFIAVLQTCYPHDDAEHFTARTGHEVIIDLTK